VGHIPGTALPGEDGNIVLAAHRDTFFRPLRNIQKGDEIALTTLSGAYRYRVESIQIVGPDDVGVLSPTKQPTLTLVTCYPFYFVGSAPKRFIVRAGLILS
jgi:sortase A